MYISYLYPDLGTSNGHKRQKSRLEQIHNLGCYKKKNPEIASYALLRMTCDDDLWLAFFIITFLVQGPSEYQPRCWIGHGGEITFTFRYAMFNINSEESSS